MRPLKLFFNYYKMMNNNIWQYWEFSPFCQDMNTDIDGTWNSKCFEWKVTVTSHNQETSFIESKQFKFFIVSEREIFLSPIKLEHMK